MYKKKYVKKIIIILMLVFSLCYTNICKADEKNGNYIDTSISKNEGKLKLNILINNTEDIYGFLGDINFDNSKLELVNCQSDNFVITIKDNKILGESVIGYKNKILAQCNFNIIEKGTIELGSINNITLSNGEKVIDNKNITIDFNNYSNNEIPPSTDNNIQSSPDEGITNPQTGNRIYIFIIIVITLSIITMFIVEKKYKIFIIPLLLILCPTSILALDTNLNITKEQLSQIRNILLSTDSNEDDKKYDYDQDNKLTINDLIISLIDYKTPNIVFDSEILKGTSDYNTEATRIIKLDSVDTVTNVSYCITDNKECTPNINYQYNNDNTVNIKLTDNSKAQKVCIKVKNSSHLEKTICDSKSYKVDSMTPQISVKQQTISIGEEETYDLKNNITVTYGKSGGEVNCTGKTEIGTNNIKCSATGNNGLTKEINYTITVNRTAERVYFLNTISMIDQANDAIVIESNGKFGMIDTGYDDTDEKAQKVVLDFLQKKLKIETLDFVITTHGHTDHIGMYGEISNAIKIKKLYIKKSGYNFGVENEGIGYEKVIDKAKSAGTTIIDVENDSTGFTFGDIEFKFYNREFISKMSDLKADNANSLATLATVHGKKIYFAGDIGMYGEFGDNLDTEEKTAKKIGEVDVYKVAHHGYTTYQNGKKALGYLNPTYAIFTHFSTHEQPKDVVNRLKSVAPNYKKSYFVGSGTVTMTIKEDGKLAFSQ